MEKNDSVVFVVDVAKELVETDVPIEEGRGVSRLVAGHQRGDNAMDMIASFRMDVNWRTHDT
jgi:hypothetical protein